jgi:AraC family transcriptional regulator
MTHPVEKALWFIETRLASELSLADIAQCSGVSRFHLSRAFGAATGQSVMRYVRARRLSKAAQRLADGAPDILTVALDVGYGSHEAFTRAFRDQFGLTPEEVRARACLNNLPLMEPIAMDESLIVELEPPRIETGRALLIAGIGARYRFETIQGIPQQWERFAPHIGHVPGQMGKVTYGACCNADGAGNFEYIAGVEVANFDDIPADFSRIRIPAQRYAVFSHRQHISRMPATVYTIWNKWLPASGYSHADAPDFERYDERFDPRTGNGVVEVWIPIKD